MLVLILVIIAISLAFRHYGATSFANGLLACLLVACIAYTINLLLLFVRRRQKYAKNQIAATWRIFIAKEEAYALLADSLAPFQERSHAELAAMIDAEPVTFEREGATGRKYQIEIQVFWDDQPGGDVRILGAIDEGGLRAFFPLTDTFLRSPSA